MATNNGPKILHAWLDNGTDPDGNLTQSVSGVDEKGYVRILVHAYDRDGSCGMRWLYQQPDCLVCDVPVWPPDRYVPAGDPQHPFDSLAGYFIPADTVCADCRKTVDSVKSSSLRDEVNVRIVAHAYDMWNAYLG